MAEARFNCDLSEALFRCEYCGCEVKYTISVESIFRHLAVQCPRVPEERAWGIAQRLALITNKDDDDQRDALAHMFKHPEDELAQLGDTATGLRLVMHPDQYVVLSSDTPHVVENARQALIMHGKILDLLGQPRTPEAAIIIHGGKGGRGSQLARQIDLLLDFVRSRLVLENDERAYSASEILGVCKDAGIPMVFDAHHHIVHKGLDSYDHPSVAAAIRAAADTWKDPSWQLTHISNGREGFNDRRHSDFISVMPACYREAPWIEVEAKAKEQAVARLRDMSW